MNHPDMIDETLQNILPYVFNDLNCQLKVNENKYKITVSTHEDGKEDDV